MAQMRQERRMEQSAAPTFRENITFKQERPRLPVQALWLLAPIEGIGILAFLAYVVTSWHSFLAQLSGWIAGIVMLLSVAGVALLIWLIIKVVKSALDTIAAFLQGLAHAWEIFQRGQNIRAEANIKRHLLHAAPNYVTYLQDKRVMVVPVQTEKYNYSVRLQEPGTTVTALPSPAADAMKPTIEEIVNHVKRNSYEIVLGRSLQSRELITVELVDAHIKLIGGSRMGKSCEAGAIIDQVRQTHDVQHVQIALLDLEYKTSRLFESDPHVILHAKDVSQVADALIQLHDTMKHRYTLDDVEVDQMPRILIYLEEFLYWKKLLKQFVDDETREQALAAFAGLATRGLKVGLHLMACAQVDYADEELRDAMAQFLAINIAFSVKPSAAQAAGFVDAELLKRNFAARQKGQFVVEAIGGSDIGVAPDFDVKAKLRSQHERKSQEPFSGATEAFQSGSALSRQAFAGQPTQRVTGNLESDVNPLEKTDEEIPYFSEEEELQVFRIARAQIATYGRVVRSKIPASMDPPRNNQFYPVVKYICDREGW